jgi:hypothetical protein
MQKFLAFSVFALGAAVAADHPALGGTWVLDPAQSVTGGSKIKSETLAIDQQPESVKISETVTGTNGSHRIRDFLQHRRRIVQGQGPRGCGGFVLV